MAALLLAVCTLSTLYVFKGNHEGILDGRPRDRIPIVLSLEVPDARSVAVMGSFNNWLPQECELQKHNGGAIWTVTLRLPAGRYEYAFLVDGGKIVPDPRAGLYQDDGFGNSNTVLVVGNGHEKAS